MEWEETGENVSYIWTPGSNVRLTISEYFPLSSDLTRQTSSRGSLNVPESGEKTVILSVRRTYRNVTRESGSRHLIPFPYLPSYVPISGTT